MLELRKKLKVVVLVLFFSVFVMSSVLVQAESNSPKYVFLFIGDGMSFPQVSSAEMYLGNMKGNNDIETELLSFSKFPVAGSMQTFDASSFVPDSASTATSMASGIKTLSGVINMDVTKTTEVTPITEELKKMGYKIGIVTSVPITHATPAAFYAKVPHRGDAYGIGKQLANTGFDYFGGGDFQQARGSNNDQEHIYEVVKRAGYKIANTKEEILSLNSNSGKVVAINPVLDGQALNYELDRGDDELALKDFVRKGVEVLDNPNGFFMMVESGKIDWAGHANDAAASIHDTIAFAEAVEEAIKVYQRYPEDTLIIVTGDHECGGMTLGFAGTGYDTFFQVIERVTMSHVEFNKILAEYKSNTSAEEAKIEDLLNDITKAYGLVTRTSPLAPLYPESVLTDSEMKRLRAALKQTMTPGNERNYSDQERIMYGGYEPLTITLTSIVNNKAGMNYSSFSHTGLPVPVYAIGNGADLFKGFYDNTDIYKKLAALLNIQETNVDIQPYRLAVGQ
ncbi:alkaline phosphatase [Natronospora cellulosivora (SeqCode)]